MKNGVMMQFFEWNIPNDGKLWKKLKEEAQHLHEIGVTSVWIPPAYKADEQEDEGYATYDLFDLGEFDQKGTVRTKYGTKQELQEAIKELHSYQISVYLDAVMNHKAGGDYIEKFMVEEVAQKNRYQVIKEQHEIEAYTGYDFPGRGDKYSSFKWHWYHFSGTGYDERTKRESIFRILGEDKHWSEGVDSQHGNYDFLLCNDLDLDREDVIQELNHWGVWVANQLRLDGMRLDAIKHMERKFIKQFLKAVRQDRGDNFYVVGEYWHRRVEGLLDYLDFLDYKIDLFDVPLHYKMFRASEKEKAFDLRNFLDKSLVERCCQNAVTFVDNHDTQRGCSLESEVEDWFKPLAYGLILLMEKGYPCVFYKDYYGDRSAVSHHQILDILLDVRKKYAYGEQYEYFDHPHVVGFTREGDNIRENSGVAFLMSNYKDRQKEMYVGDRHAGEIWFDVTGSVEEEIKIDKKGKAVFKVKDKNLSVWIKK